MMEQKKSQPIPLEIRVQQIRFLREQSGKPERMLKARLSQLLTRQVDVQRAYLAQVELGQQVSVALCIKTSGDRRAQIVPEIQTIFAAIFSSSQHLDVLFLTEDQEKEVRAVCVPFFEI